MGPAYALDMAVVACLLGLALLACWPFFYRWIVKMSEPQKSKSFGVIAAQIYRLHFRSPHEGEDWKNIGDLAKFLADMRARVPIEMPAPSDRVPSESHVMPDDVETLPVRDTEAPGSSPDTERPLGHPRAGRLITLSDLYEQIVGVRETQQSHTEGIKKTMSQISDFASAQAAAVARIQADIVAIGAKLSTLDSGTLSLADQATLTSALTAVQGVASSLDALAAPPAAATPPPAPVPAPAPAVAPPAPPAPVASTASAPVEPSTTTTAPAEPATTSSPSA